MTGWSSFIQEDIGIAATVYSLWNAFIDPLFGYITDNTRSKRGRRIPYMRFTAPFLALTFILVWFAPPQAEQQTLFWWMLISMLLYDTCYTIIVWFIRLYFRKSQNPIPSGMAYKSRVPCSACWVPCWAF
jgi:MFS family permease